MLKSFIRSLFMYSHEKELLEVTRYIRRDISGELPLQVMTKAGEREGAMATLELLNLVED